MSRASGITAFTIAVIFAVVGVVFMIQRVGALIGWDEASRDWPLVVFLVALILLMAFFVYKSIRNRLNR